jgi:hypothetical protein
VIIDHVLFVFRNPDTSAFMLRPKTSPNGRGAGYFGFFGPQAKAGP